MRRLALALIITGTWASTASAQVSDLPVEVDRIHGSYLFTATCEFSCEGSVTLRINRRDMSPVFIEPEVNGREVLARYNVRCGGPRGVSWAMRVDADAGSAATGFFRMPKCGPWKLDYGMTAHDAAIDAKKITRRAVRNEGYHYDATCHTVRVGLYDCTTEYLVGDNYCQRRHRLRYERRSGSEETRRRVKLTGSRCQTEYPRTVYHP